MALEVGMYERQEASGVESAHLSCHRLRITVLVGCALLRGGAGVRSAGGGCEPDHHGDHPAQRRALLDTSERSPAVPAKRRRLDWFGGAYSVALQYGAVTAEFKLKRSSKDETAWLFFNALYRDNGAISHLRSRCAVAECNDRLRDSGQTGPLLY